MFFKANHRNWKNQTSNRQSFQYIIYCVFTAGVRAAPGAAAASRPHQPREHSPAPRGRAEAGTHYTYTIPYLLTTELYLLYLRHFIFHIYSTISISTPYLQYYLHTSYLLHYIYHIQAGPAHIHAVRASLPPPRRRPRLSCCSFSLWDYALEI